MFSRMRQIIGIVSLAAGLLLVVGTAVSQAAPVGGNGETAVTEGSINGVTYYYGSIAGTHEILIAAHPDPAQNPEASVHILSPGGAYALTGLQDGTYYLSAFLDVDDSGGGPPGPGEPEAWYDADGDGTPDPVVVTGGNITGIDIYLGDIVQVVRSSGVDQPGCGIGGFTPCYSIEYAVNSVASAGDLVLVYAGTYTETVSMKAGVDVVSQSGPAQTVIDGENVRGPMVQAAGSALTPAVALTGFTITGGYADPTGGGISVVNGAQMVVSHTHIISNSARVLGGGVAVADNNPGLRLENCLLDDNDKTALWQNGGTAVIHNTTFTNNHGDTRGGGLLAESGDLSVSDTLFQANQAVLGGGIYASNTVITVTNSRFISNTGTSSGGGISVGEGAQFDIRQNEFKFNEGIFGAAVELATAVGVLENNMIAQSVAGSDVSQVQIRDGAVVTMHHNTVAGSDVAQGVRLQEDVEVDFANNIVAGHETGLIAFGTVTATMQHNLFWQNAADYGGVSAGAGDLYRDPGFVDAASTDYHLGICSWAVDTGANAAGAAIDFDGDARPVNGDGVETAVVDIGADERLTVTAPMPLADFSAIPTGLSVQLTNNSADTLSYTWDFGDGSSPSTAVNPDHTYADEGTYTITLVATGEFGCQDVLEMVVTVEKFKVYLPMIVR